MSVCRVEGVISVLFDLGLSHFCDLGGRSPPHQLIASVSGALVSLHNTLAKMLRWPP